MAGIVEGARGQMRAADAQMSVILLCDYAYYATGSIRNICQNRSEQIRSCKKFTPWSITNRETILNALEVESHKS